MSVKKPRTTKAGVRKRTRRELTKARAKRARAFEPLIRLSPEQEDREDWFAYDPRWNGTGELATYVEIDPDDPASAGFEIEQLPGPIFSAFAQEVWKRTLRLYMRQIPPRNRMEAICLGVFTQLVGMPKLRMRADAMLVGINLAIAAASGIAIQTHPRDLAKELKIKYSTLLTIRKLARIEVAKHRVRRLE